MSEQAEQLKARARRFALDVMTFVETLPSDFSSRHLAGQLIRSANGMAANYRAACRARSRAEFIARIGIVAEEADESSHWLDLIGARGGLAGTTGQNLLSEARELEAIFSASYGTARRRPSATA